MAVEPQTAPDLDLAIDLGDVKVRPVQQREMPDRDRNLAVAAVGNPGGVPVPVFIAMDTWAAVVQHADDDPTRELGGVLLGDRYRAADGREWVLIDSSLRAEGAISQTARFTYTQESWEQINRELEQMGESRAIVGWYHTHPSFGIFLSNHDLFIQRNFFKEPWQTALVFDPVARTHGFFMAQGAAIKLIGGFHVFAPRAERRELLELAQQLKIAEDRRKAGLFALPEGGDAVPRAWFYAFSGALGVLGLICMLLMFQVLGQAQALHEMHERTDTLTRRLADAQRRQDRYDVAWQSASRQGLIGPDGLRLPNLSPRAIHAPPTKPAPAAPAAPAAGNSEERGGGGVVQWFRGLFGGGK